MTTFHPFPRLPYELRDAIWIASLPCRLVHSSAIYGGLSAPPRPGSRSAHIMPAIAHACTHARAVAHRTGGWVVCTQVRARPVWFDASRDTVLLSHVVRLPPMRLMEMERPDHKLSAHRASCSDCFSHAAGGIVIPHLLVDGSYAERCFGELLYRRRKDTPLLMYIDEITLSGPRAAAVASGLFHLMHAPGSGLWYAWCLVNVYDPSTMRRMQAFAAAMAQHARNRGHDDAVIGRLDAAYAKLLQPPSQIIKNAYNDADLAAHKALLAVRHLTQAILVMFEEDDKAEA